MGKLIQFLVCALITVFYGPEIAYTLRHTAHEHPAVLLGVVGVAVVALLVFILRKIFAGRETKLPIEDTSEQYQALAENDSTLIT